MTPAIEPVSKKPKRQSWLSKFLLFVVSLVVLTEGWARVAFSIKPLRQRISGLDDSSQRLAWIAQHPRREESTGQYAEQYAVYHPTRGWALKPNLRDLQVPDGTILNTNSRGIRGKTEYEHRRIPGKQRIIILGDSNTLGAELSDDETYSHFLESALPNTEVLNLGVYGYGHDQMLLYLKEEGVRYHPDVVILGFVFVDTYRSLFTFDFYAKPRFKLTSGGLELTAVPVPTPDQVLAEEPYRLKALDIMVILREKLRWSLGLNQTESRNLSRLLLDEIIGTTRSSGAVPVFVDMPVLGEILDSRDFMNDREQYLHDICQERRIPCLFLRPRFRQEIKKGVKFNIMSHWNLEAHRIAAQEIEDFLLRGGLIRNDSASTIRPRTHAGTK